MRLDDLGTSTTLESNKSQLAKDGVIFSSVPPEVRRELEAGRPGTDIALALLRQVFDAGVRTIYLVPPILRGGARNYDAAQTVLAEAWRG